ncbi:MAG: aminoglycoside phosphotransferase family protein [Chloroflexi bacterium]|nr:MAG: aminoglycoside phosphotransferase family protein [Chloroflexota bacterium]
MQRILTIPPSQDEVAQAADEISGGALARVTVEPWPRGRSHHAYVLTTPGEEKFLFKVHRRPHAGRMRRFLHLAELLRSKQVPHPTVRWFDVEKRTLEVPYYIQDFISGEDAARSLGTVSFTDQHRVGAELGQGLRTMHHVEYVDTPMPWSTELDDRLRTRAAECRFLDALDQESHATVIAYYEERRDALEGVARRLTHDDLNLANLLLQRRDDGWHFVAFLDFERARGRDPLLDLVRLESWTLPACPAMVAPFKDAYAHFEDDQSRRRSEIYEVYLLLAGIVWYRQNELPERERFCRERLHAWLAGRATP